MLRISQKWCSINFISNSNLIRYGSRYTADKSWDGAIGKILAGEFDSSLPGFKPTPERLKVLTFALTSYREPPVLVTNFPKIETFSLSTIGRIFQWRVWVTLLLSIIVLGFIGAFGQQKRPKNAPKIAIQLSEMLSGSAGTDLKADGLAFSVLLLFWGFGCVLLAGYFSSEILASALVPSITRTFTDMKQAYFDSWGYRIQFTPLVFQIEHIAVLHPL